MFLTLVVNVEANLENNNNRGVNYRQQHINYNNQERINNTLNTPLILHTLAVYAASRQELDKLELQLKSNPDGYLYNPPREFTYSGGMIVKASAYTNSPDECWGNPNITSTGTRVSEGRTIAVSRDLYPSLVDREVHLIDKRTGEYVGKRKVEDKMGPRARKAIDIFMFSKREALKFGRREFIIIPVDDI